MPARSLRSAPAQNVRGSVLVITTQRTMPASRRSAWMAAWNWRVYFLLWELSRSINQCQCQG